MVTGSSHSLNLTTGTMKLGALGISSVHCPVSSLGSGSGRAQCERCRLRWAVVDLSELGLRSGEADAQPLNLTEPALAFGLGDAFDEVVADVDQTGPLVGVRPEHRAADAGVLVDAGSGERPGAGPDGDLALLEVAEEARSILHRWGPGTHRWGAVTAAEPGRRGGLGSPRPDRPPCSRG